MIDNTCFTISMIDNSCLTISSIDYLYLYFYD